MFNAKIYTVSILSSGVVLEEVHIAREVIACWNIEEGEKQGVAFLVVPNNSKNITPDIFIFVIDNYVDEQKVEAAISTGAKVLLLFSSYHDEKNSMESEVKTIEILRQRIQHKCICVGYDNSKFEETLIKTMVSQVKNKTSYL